jgi:RimJ/RimL family protein N-acetyltransferase
MANQLELPCATEIFRCRNVVLRKTIQSDIADYVKWTTTETEWRNWDVPWETWGADDAEEFVDIRRLTMLLDACEDIGTLEIEADGCHVGWVVHYEISCNDFKGKTAVGLVIPPVSARNRGYGKDALVLWMAYLFEKLKVDAIYAQTWSGNLPMIALAHKIGFTEVRRIKDLREVRSQKYDALTFSISKDDFVLKCKNNKEM